MEVLAVYENQRTVSGELRIVVDVIDFNAYNPIQAIRAYLGRGDSG